MSTELSAPPSATPDVIGGSSSPDAAPAAVSSPAPDTGTSSPDVKTDSPVQAQESTSTPQADDPLAGLPTDEELQAAVSNKIPHAEALARIKSAYSEVKPQLDELREKFSPFESVADRFTSAEQLQPLIELHDTLFSDFERDPNGELVPATTKAADLLFTRDPQRAGFLWAEMADKQVNHPETGRPVPLIDLALEGMRDDPAERAKALQILGGVEPSAQAPTWAPTEEQLAVVRPELQDIFRNLPYDEREDLSANTPDFINKYLQKEKFQADLMQETKRAQELQQQQDVQRQAYARQQAEAAGEKYVEQGFREGFTKFANSVVERSQFVKPVTAEEAQALNLSPEAAQAFNQKAAQTNKGVGKLIALASATLSHPDLQWMAVDVLKELGVQDDTFSAFDEARREYAGNARNYGELEYQGRPEGAILSNATRAMSRMVGKANLVASPLFGLISQLFEMKADNYNATLNSAPSARPPVNGQRYDPTTASQPRSSGFLTKDDIYRQFGS